MHKMCLIVGILGKKGLCFSILIIKKLNKNDVKLEDFIPSLSFHGTLWVLIHFRFDKVIKTTLELTKLTRQVIIFS